MLATLLLPAQPDLQLQEVRADPTGLRLVVATTAPETTCPLCATPTTHRHSGYQRTLADAPWATVAVRLEWHTRRFFCPNPTCPRRIFTERLPALTAPSARRTARLTMLVQEIGLALGGEAGARLAAPLGLPTSPTTLLRLVRTRPDPPAAAPRCVGLDDFAFRKGYTYGTILVDHATGAVLDLLDDRQAESTAAWLRAHPTVEVITRDRAEVYIAGATAGAPQAIQVADRWHLLHNLSEAVTAILTRLYPALCQALAAGAADEAAEPLAAPPVAEPAPPPARPLTRAQQRAADRRAGRQARYEQICALHQAGQSFSTIARQVGVDPATVRKYIRAGHFVDRPVPVRQPHPHRVLDPYKPYLEERWAVGCHSGMQLWHELQEQGYPGKRTVVFDYVQQLRQRSGEPGRPQRAQRPRPAGAPQRPRRIKVARREWRTRLTQPLASLPAPEAALLEEVCARLPVLGVVHDLVQQFGRLIREQQRPQLDTWLQAALTSGVAELARFARGVQADYAAVAAALEWPFSNGPTEGHVNRLKMLKRQMYGRAKFDLLRKRVLCAT